MKGEAIDRGAGRAPAAGRRSSRPRATLSVLCAVHEKGGLTAAALRSLRDVADEIVVAFDSRIPLDELGPLEGVADELRGFEFTGANRFRPWLREQASGDWLLLLDSDEVPSEALLSLLPSLVADRSLSGYLLPRWSPFPTAKTRTYGGHGSHWRSDQDLRLVRNDGRLWFPGTNHTGARCDPPVRFVDAPIIHLHLLTEDEHSREQKVEKYEREQFGLFTWDGLPLNRAFYLPERLDHLDLIEMPDVDAARVSAVLEQRDVRRRLSVEPIVVPGNEVDQWWPGRAMTTEDYAAAITVNAGPEALPAGAHGWFEVEVVNLGAAVWPATALARSGPEIRLSYHWEDSRGGVVHFDGLRSFLPVRVVPGQRLQLLLVVVAPSVPDAYTLVIDLVHESVRWFGIDERVDCTVEPGVREELLSYAPEVVPIAAALAQRRRLQQMDSLAAAFGYPEPESVGGLAFGDWALDRTTMDFLTAWIRRHRISRILEFGSGTSTACLAMEVAASGGRVLSVDQDETYAMQTEQLLAEWHMESYATVITSELAEIEACGVTTKCYDLTGAVRKAIRSLSPQLVVIDGPSLVSGASRLAVAPSLVPLLDGAVPFAMDDAFRDAELDIADRWATDPEILVDGIVPMGKGLLVGHISGSRPGSKRAGHTRPKPADWAGEPERDALVAERDALVSERDALLVTLHAELAAQAARLSDIYASTSWQISAPVRIAGRMWRWVRAHWAR